MKLNLYKCSSKDCEWYSLAKGICEGAIPLQCGGGFWPFDVPPEKIEFFKEVEIDISSLLEEETKMIKHDNGVLESKTKELEEYQHLGWRLYFK
jgi:hypothetical protein